MSTLRASLAGFAHSAAAPMIAVAVAMLAAASPSLAQYKVVGPDGKVTYTDRPTATEAGTQVLPLRRDGLPGTSANSAPNVTNAGPPLPTELRAVVARFPVTLFTSSDCSPCETGRKLLQQRGVPYAEKVIGSDDDIAALQRLSGGRTVPALTVGSQAIRGFLESDWLATLDLAGYPRESRLPRGWQAPPPSPLVARNPVETPVANAPAARQPAEPVVSPSGSTGIRF